MQDCEYKREEVSIAEKDFTNVEKKKTNCCLMNKGNGKS